MWTRGRRPYPAVRMAADPAPNNQLQSRDGRKNWQAGASMGMHAACDENSTTILPTVKQGERGPP
jgi:hypothetical protein